MRSPAGMATGTSKRTESAGRMWTTVRDLAYLLGCVFGVLGASEACITLSGAA